MHIQHAMLRPDTIEFRGFQANLARISMQEDTLVVVPTGLGKTVIALLVLADALAAGARRILVLAPTKPLVEQHAKFLADTLAETTDRPDIHVLTGNIAPTKRQAMLAADGIYCATPQVIQNDVVAGRVDLGQMDWIVFDEAHRAVGEYAYTFLGERLTGGAANVRRMGLTASPGHDAEKIREVQQNLGLPRVEVRTPADPDVAPYVQAVRMDTELLPLPPSMARVSSRLRDALADRVKVLQDDGWLPGTARAPTRRALLDCAHKLQAITRTVETPDSNVFTGLSVQAQAMKLLHMIELAETQGADPFRSFIDKMKIDVTSGRSSKATRSILADDRVNEAYHIAGHDVEENPKRGRLEVLVREQLEADPESLVLVFANYRHTCEAIADALAAVPGVRPKVFVGQGKRNGQSGLTQKQQQEVLQAFRDGEHNVLVATSVAEEGLDIPATDLVIFYEPIPSEIRSIQRRGRTGRHREGRVVVLMTKGTQDEGAYWTAKRKEKQMVAELQQLRREVATRPDPAQRTLSETPEVPIVATPPRAVEVPAKATGPRILCDTREQAGGVVRHLYGLDAQLDLRVLDVGDFVLSDRVVVERKECRDFVDSLLDQRLFEQLRALQAYAKPLMVIEGESLYGHRNLAPEAIHGALASVTIDYGVTVIQTRDAAETARFLLAVAKREQNQNRRRVAVRQGRHAMPDEERLVHILAGFPHVDATRARGLLDHFGSLAAVFAATEAQLAAAPNIGPKTAEGLRRLLDLDVAARQLTETVS